MLCLLADSPMHTELTNTPVPGTSLNPCRVCVLSSKSLQDKKTLSFLSKFQPNHLRSTEKTIQDSKEVWRYVKENARTINKEKLDEKSAEFGIRDQRNRKFAKEIIAFREKKKALLKDGRELPEDMEQAIPQGVMDLESKDESQMLSPFLKLKGMCC
ncbi:hypothetical protein PGTUg99_013745 [Puccinia graminis f. sp. tritici]|uniref:Uncharacterized protein n=1 Tax=Puccinia graminis f. sp. tritici TaxID=56615 RepID=A0A5B0R833_PUCGR|nr:hypothetical protein PGTUg99_013745 [Puccinia graminis f. sp. tritici]